MVDLYRTAAARAATTPSAQGEPLAWSFSLTLRRSTKWLPLALSVAAAVGALLGYQTSLRDILAYGGYFLVAVAIPGTLVYRAVMGFSESLLTDVAWGCVTGWLLELASWASMTALGVNHLMWVVPIGVIGAFGVAPRLRNFWRRPPGSPCSPPVLAWGVAAALMLALGLLCVGYFAANELPPSNEIYFPDLPYELGLAAEAVRSMPLHVPQASADGFVHYYVFANAHLASAHLLSDVDLTTVLLRTWIVPASFVVISTAASLAMRVTRSAAAAAITALLMVGVAPEFGASLSLMSIDPLSPSFVYSVGFCCLLLALLVGLVRGETRMSCGKWLMLAAVTLAAAGAKSSVLPDLLAGLAAYLVGRVVILRQRPSSDSVVAAVLVLAVFVGTFPLFDGKAADLSTVRPFGLIAFWAPGGVALSLVAFAVAVLSAMPLFLTAAIGIADRSIRSDGAAQLLGCVTLAGFAAAWVVHHQSFSQFYFWLSAAPAAATLTSWSVVAKLRRVTVHRRRLAIGLGLVALTCSAVFGFLVPLRLTFLQLLRGAISPVGLGFLLTGLGLLVALALAKGNRVTLLVASVGTLTVISAGCALAVTAADPVRPSLGGGHALAQSEAAVWVARHVPGNSVLATNSHCRVTPTRPRCDTADFWLSGFGQHRVLVGGWAFTSAATAESRGSGRGPRFQPYHDQRLLDLNDSAFKAPAAAALRRLYTQYGVRWLVGDRYAGPVSSDLGRYGKISYQNSWVTIYRLNPIRMGVGLGRAR